jgi:hypothetical protein
MKMKKAASSGNSAHAAGKHFTMMMQNEQNNKAVDQSIIGIMQFQLVKHPFIVNAGCGMGRKLFSLEIQ